MTGNDAVLSVYAGQAPIASLSLIDDQLHWQYHETWQQSGYAVSPHLPLQGDCSPLNVQRFLRNLLPEGNGLDELVSSYHLSKYNTFGLVRALGLDTPGALVFLPPAQTYPVNAAFRMIGHDELEQRLKTRDSTGLIIWDGKPRLSVAGVQDKINVLLNPDGQPGFGDGLLCSTHLLKFEKQSTSHLVLNEFVSMQLAKSCGIPVAPVQLKRYGPYPALLVERFDRQQVSMTMVKRRHIIDGCQALNVSPEYKYERNFGSGRDVAHIREGASLIKLFDFANQCANPAQTKQGILDWVLFNILIFNYDAHGKNISFFVGPNGLVLTPFYDLVNIKMYPDFEHEMAMGLGDEFDGQIVHAYQLADFADSCHLPRVLVARRLDYLIKKLQTALDTIVLSAAANDDEHRYLTQYLSLVYTRCDHLSDQIADIPVIKL